MIMAGTNSYVATMAIKFEVMAGGNCGDFWRPTVVSVQSQSPKPKPNSNMTRAHSMMVNNP
jgi:hypothetical protein